jgi:hypothetical protein
MFSQEKTVEAVQPRLKSKDNLIKLGIFSEEDFDNSFLRTGGISAKSIREKKLESYLGQFSAKNRQILPSNYYMNILEFSNNKLNIIRENNILSSTLLISSVDMDFFENKLHTEVSDFVLVDSKLEKTVSNFIDKDGLKDIGRGDVARGIDMVMYFLSHLSSTYNNSTEEGPMKNLWSPVLNETIKTTVNDNTVCYTKVIDLLLKGTEKHGPIISINRSYMQTRYSRQYALTERYRKTTLVPYYFKTKDVLTVYRLNQAIKIKEGLDNPVIKNLHEFYKTVSLPNDLQIVVEADRLVKAGYKTNKGLLLKWEKDILPGEDGVTSVENSIKVFKYCIHVIPTDSGLAAGGRVVDPFTLMPKWIRNLCKVDGQQFEEADYSALHPNIANKIYKGGLGKIDHQDVADYLGVTKQEVKVLHLSFFNMKSSQMMQSPLLPYYQDKAPNLLKNIMGDKKKANSHKISSRKMFKREVDIMRDVIKDLNHQGIYVGYVYDALFYNPKYSSQVRSAMELHAARFGVLTSVNQELASNKIK